MKIQDMLRALHTQRWSIVNCSRQQTVAEHSWAVAVIADEIARVAGLSQQTRSDIRKYAIYHDVAEAVIGDIPTPTKRRLGNNIQELEEELYSPNGDVHPTARWIVKAADQIEAINFLEVNGVGRHSDKILSRLLDEIAEFIRAKEEGDIKEAAMTTYLNVRNGETMF